MKKESTIERIDKLLSNAGFASRKEIKKFLKSNEVTINEKRVTVVSKRVDFKTDKVMVNGFLVQRRQPVYFLLNKPKGVVSTTDDPQNRQTVVDLIDTDEKIYPVGRLDKETHGLMLLTNDGELTHKLIHPRYHIPKIYMLRITSRPSYEKLAAMRNGVLLSDGITLPARVIVYEDTLLEVTLIEGRNRQIRRMCEELQIELVDLQRVAIGTLKLGKLQTGEYRRLTKKEILQLKNGTLLE